MKPLFVLVLAALLAGCGSSSDPHVGPGSERGGQAGSTTYGMVSCRGDGKLVTLPNGSLQLTAERRCIGVVVADMSEGLETAKAWLKSECPEPHARWLDPRTAREITCKVMSHDLTDFSTDSKKIAAKKPLHCEPETEVLGPLSVACGL